MSSVSNRGEQAPKTGKGMAGFLKSRGVNLKLGSFNRTVSVATAGGTTCITVEMLGTISVIETIIP